MKLRYVPTHYDTRRTNLEPLGMQGANGPKEADVWRALLVKYLAIEVAHITGAKRYVGTGAHKRRAVRCIEGYAQGLERRSVKEIAEELKLNRDAIYQALRKNRPLRSGLRFEFVGKGEG